MDITSAARTARWIDTADVAKLIRKHIKTAFPAVKFSVRSSRYAGGSSIDVTWTDGPTQSQVDAVVGGFEGSRFDGMIDLQYGAHTWYCPEHGARTSDTYGHGMGDDGPVKSRCCHRAELVKMGVDYVHTSRRLSEEFTAELAAQVSRETGLPYDPSTYVQDAREWMSTLLHRASVHQAR